ncbi:MAG: hypothetical protein CMN65_10605 [Sphingomonadaceae bacterium]|jgi:hypothetical protein|nr:hypothetical protein [Sphingomonadaceae bacterium]|tara:strand:- start:561 stop:953 length:393 start_codon:yes stop_codon:yes gene_type:complete
MRNAEATSKRDLAASRLHLILIWGVPFALLIGLNFTEEFLQPHERVGIAAVLFLWMGAACSINAVRCRRLHCIIAGPAFLIGAVLLTMVAFGLADFGSDGPNVIIWGTFGVVAGSFIAERIAGKYWRRPA